jgi:hypothetical protein
MIIVAQLLGFAMGVGALVCYIMVVIQMFKHGRTGPGLISTIGLIACGLGGLFAYIYGWTKAGEWRLKNLMLTWTALIVLQIGINVLVVVPTAFQAARQAAIQAQERAKAKEEAVPAPTPDAAPTPEAAPEKAPATP